MIKKLTNKKIVLISATVMVVVLILGFTLALWSRNFTQTGTNTITTDCFNIEYSENDATSLVNAYPQTDEDGLKNVSYDVTIFKGTYTNSWASDIRYVQPVINLKSDVIVLSGNGTESTPYVIDTN